MEFEVLLYSSATNYGRFSLKVVQSVPRIRLEYLLTDGTVFITDFLDIFHTVKMDETDAQVISLIGPVTRRIKFVSSSGFSNFCTYLKQVLEMKAEPGNSQTLTLKPKFDVEKLQKTNQKKKFFDPISITSYPTEGEFEFADDFTSDFIWQKPVKIAPSESEILKPGDVLKSVVPFSALDPERKTLTQLWEQILLKGKPKKEIFEEYQSVKSQWSQSITRFRYRNSRNMRVFIEKLENLIENSEFKTHVMRKLVYDIAMSLFAYTYNSIVMTEELFRLIELFVSIFVVGSKSSFASPESKVCLINDEIVSFDEAAAFVFCIFTNFYMQFMSEYDDNCTLPRPQDIIASVKTFTTKFSPSSSIIFDMYSQEEIEHAAHLFYSFLILMRKKEDAELLISALLTNSHPGVFMRCIICCSLNQFCTYIKSNNVLFNMPSQDSTQGQGQGQTQTSLSHVNTPFQPMFDAFITQVNFRLLLHNAEMLQSYTAPYLKINL